MANWLEYQYYQLRTEIFVIFDIFKGLFRAQRFNSDSKMAGKTVIVTCGDTGIGQQIVRDLATRGARIIVGSGTPELDSQDIQKIIEETENNKILIKPLDVGSTSSVRKFCADILRTEERLDVVINNTDLFGLQEIYDDGLGRVMATNYFCPFLLTHLLSELLLKSAPSRVVNVTSNVHKVPTTPDLSSLNRNNSFAYMHSMLHAAIFTKEMARRLQGTGVTVNACHTGTTFIPITYKVPPMLKDFLYYLVQPIVKPCLRSAESAAQTLIYLAVSEDLSKVTGKYFDNCQEEEPSKLVKDMEYQKLLWMKTEEIVQLKPSENVLNLLSPVIKDRFFWNEKCREEGKNFPSELPRRMR